MSQKLKFRQNKPENPFQTMPSQKIANIIPPDSSQIYQNWQIAKITKLPKKLLKLMEIVEIAKIDIFKIAQITIFDKID